MNDLPNLDRLDDLDRGKQPAGEADPFAPYYGMTAEELAALPDSEPEPPAPSDTATQARCLIPLLTIPGVTTADQLEASR